tara:strand:- start:4214 stop:4537 length:324 start_codon:yes stop_codon:yes gene_type:complete
MLMEKNEVLEFLKSSVENMNKHHQVEILRILSKHLCKLNENKSGVFVNLSYIDENVIDELKQYISYTKDQEDSLTTTEYQKNEFKNSLLDNKEDKDIVPITYSITSE